MEETVLLQEEMRRVLKFFEWKANWWRAQGGLRGNVAADIASGLKAYAEKQAVIYEHRANRFAQKWLPLLKAKGITSEWAATYSQADKQLAPHTISADSESDIQSDNDSVIDIDEEYISDF